MLLEKENKALKQQKRLSIYHKMLMSSVECFLLEQKKISNQKRQIILKNTCDAVLEGQWITNTRTTENSMETY